MIRHGPQPRQPRTHSMRPPFWGDIRTYEHYLFHQPGNRYGVWLVPEKSCGEPPATVEGTIKCHFQAGPEFFNRFDAPREGEFDPPRETFEPVKPWTPDSDNDDDGDLLDDDE